MTKESALQEKIVITVDSGATDSVAAPSSASSVTVVDSAGSRAEATYKVANGDIIHNLCQKE